MFTYNDFDWERIPHLEVTPLGSRVYPCIPSIKTFLGAVPEEDLVIYYDGPIAFRANTLHGNSVFCYLIDSIYDNSSWMVCQGNDIHLLLESKVSVFDYIKNHLKYVVFVEDSKFSRVVNVGSAFLEVFPDAGPASDGFFPKNSID